MCGIVGAVASRNITPILVEGLKRLEYRGYDSCGVAVHADGGLKRARSVSRVAELAREVAETHLEGFTGIAHTRWATHGAPVVKNAHPHFSRDRIALVHNGIIENHDALRDELKQRGYVFDSQTDTEVIAHLVDHLYDGDLFAAVQQAVLRLQGAYAIAVFCRDEPHRVVGARAGSPLIVGVGLGENFLASDAMALAGVTDQIIYLEEGDVVDVQLGRVWIVDRAGRELSAAERPVKTVLAHSGAVELGPYRHYMQKEIFEQPRAIADTLEGVEGIVPDLFGAIAKEVFAKIDSVLILACGTSYYSGLTAKYWLESIAKNPVQRGGRQRIPLPRQRAQSAHAGRHHFAVRRDGRHDGRAETRAIARPHTHAHHLQRRDQRDGARMRARLHHARGHRDRRRLDQGIHHATRRSVSAHAGARQATRPLER